MCAEKHAKVVLNLDGGSAGERAQQQAHQRQPRKYSLAAFFHTATSKRPSRASEIAKQPSGDGEG